MELADVPRHRPLVFDKMESLVKEMQDPENGVPVRSQKLFLSVIPSAFTGYDFVEWVMERFNPDEISNVEAALLGTRLCQFGYLFPVNDLKNLVLKDDSSLYRFQSPYYWPWQPPRVAGSSGAPTLGPDNVEYAIYLVKRTLRNKQRHALEDYEQEALLNLKKNLAAKWDFITMQADEQGRLAKDRTKGDKIISDSQERAYWRVARPPPGVSSALDPCPVPVRARHPRLIKKRTPQQVKKEIEQLKASLDRTRVKTSIALEALLAYSETFAPYDPWLSPPQPANPWLCDDTLFWQINNPLVDVPSEKRVQRWALSIEELVSDPTGLQEFTNFLRKEYSHENIRFWTAVMDLRRSSNKQIPKKLEEIYEEFLKPGAPCEINIDGATAEKVAEGLKSRSRYALDDAADHVYGLLLKKDCYPRFIRSDHFQRLLAEGRNVYQKKAKFFNFGGQVKKKPCAPVLHGVVGGGPAGLSRRRGSDRSLSGSAHELAHCAARAPDPPPHSHSQSNLAEGEDEAVPWEGARRHDSGSSSSEVSGAGERARRLPQQSTLDGGLRGAPPPLRRLSAVEPRHLAPLASPPRSPRPAPPPAPTPAPPPPHPTPTISVSSAPDDSASPDEPRSVAVSDEPSSVFASAAATPTEPRALTESDESHPVSESRCTLRADEGDALDLPPIDEAGPAFVTTVTCIGDLPPDASVEDEVPESPLAVAWEPLPCCSNASSRSSALSGLNAASGPSAPSESRTLSGSSAPSGLTAPSGSNAPSDSSAPSASNVPSGSSVLSEASSSSVPSVTSEVPCYARAPVAPLAVGEDIGVEDDNADKVPSAAAPAPSPAPASDSDATKRIAHRDRHKDEVTSASDSSVVKRASRPVAERSHRNDVCPWEDENSCESDAPFVKTYATLGYL